MRLSVSDTTVREFAQETGAKMATWQRTEPVAVRAFCRATSSSRPTARASTGPSGGARSSWTSSRSAIARNRRRPTNGVIANSPQPKTFAASDQFGDRWKAWAKRRQIREVSADGAKWIREEARLNLTGALGVLDVYHALEAINDTSKKLFGDGSPAATIWADTLRTTLLERGGNGFDERWQDTRDSFPANAPQRTRLEELRNDLGHRVPHLNYAERLREGRSIGSGQIEGTCQNLIGRRLKQTATRWRVGRDSRSLACVPAA